ncbi:MAG: universal stress protein [Actinomycetota bacterium]
MEGTNEGIAVFSTIIVGTDGSPDARRALGVAAELASGPEPVDVHVVTAFHPLTVAELRQLAADLPQEFRPLLHAHVQADSTRDEAARILGAAGVDAVFHQVDGEPADVILQVAEQEGADLIVVGSRGEGMAKRLLHGSVSTNVFHHASCAVLVVKAE